MGPITFAFVVIPCITASFVAWALRDWRLAGAVAAGTLGLLFVPGLTTALPATTFLLPALVGAAIGATVSGIAIYRSPDVTIWTRMLWALALTFILSLFALMSLT